MVDYNKLISRQLYNFIKREHKLAGLKLNVDKLVSFLIIFGLILFAIPPFVLYIIFKYDIIISILSGFAATILFYIVVYAIIEFRIEQRKNYVESVWPDFLIITSANIRSGISIDKALVNAARPEFTYFSNDVQDVVKLVYAGQTIQQALSELTNRYRSTLLARTIRIINQAIEYGGGVSDILNQIAKETRSQQTIQKEVSGQLFMYTIFIAFATLIGAPVLYGLTSQMIGVTESVWASILKENPQGLPTAGVAFLKPSPPQITTQQYKDFALGAIIIITGMGSFIISAISTGSVIKGFRYFPIFIAVGILVYYAVATLIAGVFSTILNVPS